MRAAAAFATAVLCWIVGATPGRAIDGDTFSAVADIWPGLSATIHVRVLGVDTPELKGETRAKAAAAKAFTEKWIDQAGGDVILTVGCGRPSLDSFGRVLARVRTLGGKDLADDLIAAGHGVKR